MQTLGGYKVGSLITALSPHPIDRTIMVLILGAWHVFLPPILSSCLDHLITRPYQRSYLCASVKPIAGYKAPVLRALVEAKIHQLFQGKWKDALVINNRGISQTRKDIMLGLTIEFQILMNEGHWFLDRGAGRIYWNRTSVKRLNLCCGRHEQNLEQNTNCSNYSVGRVM